MVAASLYYETCAAQMTTDLFRHANPDDYNKRDDVIARARRVFSEQLSPPDGSPSRCDDEQQYRIRGFMAELEVL